MSESAPGRAPATKSDGRISFFEEQAKRRVQARIWGLVTMSVTGLLGWVLGFLILTAALFYTQLLLTFSPKKVEQAVDRLMPKGDVIWWYMAAAALVFAVGLWLVVRLIFGRDSSSAFLTRLKAREPNPEDPEEKQLVNVAEEMAIAAAAPVPQVRLFDGEAINAAALGSDAKHPTLLVGRRMLDVLDRDETQGVIGHLTASAINGDLSLSAEMLRMFYALGLAVTILDLPFSRKSWGAFWSMLRFAFRSSNASRTGASEDSDAVAARLTESLQPEGLEAMTQFMRRLVEPESNNALHKIVGALIMMPLLPIILMRLAAALLYGLLSLFVLGPLVAVLLRSRRRLADATAVQLTRNPDGIACALVHLAREASTVRNAGWAEMLFVVGPEAAGGRAMARMEQRLTTARDNQAGWRERAQVGLAAAGELTAADDPTTAPRKHNFIFGFHPSLNSRIAQLKRMGATKVQWTVRRDYSGWIVAAVVILVVGGVVLLALISK